MSFKVEVYTDQEWVGNGVRWPDHDSASAAGRDLLMRWFVPTDFRVVESTEEPNCPTWTDSRNQ